MSILTFTDDTDNFVFITRTVASYRLYMSLNIEHLSFLTGEHCEEHVAFFKQLFGEQALLKPVTV